MKKTHAILTVVLGLASFAGAVVAPILYIGGIKEDVVRHGVEIDNLKSAVAEIPSLRNAIALQNTRSLKMELYMEWGVLPRLQIDQKELLKKAAAREKAEDALGDSATTAMDVK